MRLIDVNDAIERMRKAEVEMHTINGVKAVDIGTVISFLQNQLVVDAVPVVRCKDCKQWRRNIGFTDNPNGHCFYHDIDTNGFDFCSYGERRDSDV